MLGGYGHPVIVVSNYSELETRWEYARPEDYNGINENCRIDRTLHSLFGASKAAADLMAQEYGRYFGMKVCIFRCGCLTGPSHSGVELHGFLSYLVKVAISGGTSSLRLQSSSVIADHTQRQGALSQSMQP